MNKDEQRFHAAVAAMQGMLGNPAYAPGLQSASGPLAVALSCVMIADALIAELNKPVKGE